MKDFLFCLFLINIGFTSIIDDVELKISMEKTEFYIHEPIMVKITLKNKTDQPLEIVESTLENEGMILCFEHSKGNIPSRKVFYHILAYGKWTLKPNEEFEAGTWNISTFYGNNSYTLYSFFDEGEYKITARLRTDGQKKRVELRGKTLQERRREGRELLYAIASNQLSFVVKIPIGEDFMAYTLLDSALRFEFREKYKDSWKTDNELASNLYLSLVRNFPQSSYVAQALKNLSIILGPKRSEPLYCDLLISGFQTFIISYPNSWLIKEIKIFERLQNLFDVFNRKENFIKFLLQISVNHPNTLAAEEAQKRLKELHGDKNEK